MFVQYICKFELTTRALGIEGLCAPMEVRMVKHLVKFSTAWKVTFFLAILTTELDLVAPN